MVSGSGMQNEGCEFSAHFRETVAHAIAEHFAVNGFACQSRLSCRHDGAHLLDRSRGGFGDCFGDGRVHFGFAGAGGQIRFDDGELFRFLGDEFRAVAFGELVDGFLALFYEGLQNLDGFGFVEWANLFHFFVLDGRLDSPQDAEAQFLFGAHGVDQILLNFFRKTHLRLLMLLNIADQEIRREGMVRGAWRGRSRTYLTVRERLATLSVQTSGEKPARDDESHESYPNGQDQPAGRPTTERTSGLEHRTDYL